MTRTKFANVDGRRLCVWDSTHDVLFALLVEEARRDGRVPVEWLDDWATASSTLFLAANVLPEDEDDCSLLSDLVRGVRDAIGAHGDFTTVDVRQWSVHGRLPVASGVLRGDLVTVEQLFDLLDAVSSTLEGTLPPDPDGSLWFVGAPGGRTVL